MRQNKLADLRRAGGPVSRKTFEQNRPSNTAGPADGIESAAMLLRFTSTGHALSRETRATFPLSQAATMPRLTQLTVGRFPISWCFWMATTGLHRFGSLRQKVLRSRPTYLNPCIRKAEEDEEHHSRFDSAQQRLKEVVALL